MMKKTKLDNFEVSKEEKKKHPPCQRCRKPDENEDNEFAED